MGGFSYQPDWLREIPTPSYVVEEKRLLHNLEILQRLQERTGCLVRLAQKAFSMYSCYPLIGKYLKGAAASGLFEARLAHEEFPGENHVFNPAFKEEEFLQLLQYSDHFVFNSMKQWKKFGAAALRAGKECGLRINPEHSTQEHAIYDPCSPLSRLGVRLSELDASQLAGLSGFHFHTLCEQWAEPLAETLPLLSVKVDFGGTDTTKV